MEQLFEELDYQKTALGELVLRRRRSPSVPDELVYEVTINHEMLMSSSVNSSEQALATLALEPLTDQPLDVLVGGLGLGYTAAAALDYPNVRRLDVVELLAPVIGWHRSRLLPLADKLLEDSRCSLIEADFFDYVGPDRGDRLYDVILLDIDHAPDCFLHPRHREFYTTGGLENLARCLHRGGIFAIWSAWDPPAAFREALRAVFHTVQEHELPFVNPHMNKTDTNWVITAKAD
jgi:spermidine synthase